MYMYMYMTVYLFPSVLFHVHTCIHVHEERLGIELGASDFSCQCSTT